MSTSFVTLILLFILMIGALIELLSCILSPLIDVMMKKHKQKNKNKNNNIGFNVKLSRRYDPHEVRNYLYNLCDDGFNENRVIRFEERKNKLKIKVKINNQYI